MLAHQIREGAEEIEAMGIERSREKIVQAKIVMCLADASVDGSIDEVETWTNELQAQYPEKRILLIINKSDIQETTLKSGMSISAKAGTNISELREHLVELVMGDFDMANETIVTNARHVEALDRTSESLDKALNGLNTGITADFVAMDIRQGMHHLGTITGDISTDDLLGNIFSKFCIGK